MFALALAVVMLRLQRLNEIPPGLHHDEWAHGVDALTVLQGEHTIFFPRNNGREGLIVYTIAPAISFFGKTMLAIRLPTALASAGTVFVVFWLGQLLFGRDEESGRATAWRGLLVGGIGAGLLAVSIGQTVIGRTALRGNFLPLILSLCLALLWWGWKQRSWWRIALAGACAGLLPYTYIPARFTPFLFLLFGLSFALPLRSVTRERVRSELPWVGIFVVITGLVAAPILVHFALHPEDFFSYIRTWLFHPPGGREGASLGSFLINGWNHLLLFGLRGDPRWWPDGSGQPILNLWEAFFFWLGVGMAVRHWQQPAYRLLLLWLGVLILPAMLTRVDSPDTLRMIGAVPAIYLLVGVGMWEAFRFLRERFFQAHDTKAAIAVGAVISGLILVQGVITYRIYFQKWASAREVYIRYNAPWADLARILNAQPLSSDMIYLIPHSFWYNGFEYLYQGATPVHLLHIHAHPSSPGGLDNYQGTAPVRLLHTTMSDLARKLESTLAAMENISSVKVVDWDDDLYRSDHETELLDILLGKYGRYLGSDAYVNFQVHTYTDISLDRPWTFYEHLAPLTVDYDGGLSLQWIALGQGEKEKQLSSRQPLDLGQERSLWVDLHWQTAPGLDIDYAISLRLYNTEGEGVYQNDTVLWESAHTTTGNGESSAVFNTLVQLDFPIDLLPGDYELRLVVYNAETLKPTVQLGVWEPEVVLARLRLAEVQ